MNQTDLAKLLGISRPILVAIENGQRAPTATMLTTIATALDVRIRDLATLPAADEPSLVRFRDPLRTDESARAGVDALIDFGRYYRMFESKTGSRFRSRAVPPLSLDELNGPHAAADLAASERARLNLGDGPLLDLHAVLEQDVGILIFGLTELRETKIAGLFTYSLDLPLVGFNVVQNDARRQRWTLAHEYAHFLTNRYDAEITYEEPKARDTKELFAERFATHFLMPSSGVSRRFKELIGVSESATVAHVVLLAGQFQVSFRAMCERLEELERIPKHTYAHVVERGFKPLEAERSLGIERKDESLPRYPQRYLRLMRLIWNKGAASEGDVATYLRTDRLSAREILGAFETGKQLSVDRPLEGVV